MSLLRRAKRGLPFDGAGEKIPYTELLVVTATCSTLGEARRVNALFISALNGYAYGTLDGIGDSAALADASDTPEYPASRTFLLAVRVGRRVASLGIEAPSGVKAVNRALMVSLARRVAANLSTG